MYGDEEDEVRGAVWPGARVLPWHAHIRRCLHVLLQAGALQVYRATNRPDAGRNYAALYEQLSRRRDEVLTVAAEA